MQDGRSSKQLSPRDVARQARRYRANYCEELSALYLISAFTGRNPLASGIRMVLIAAAAASITFGIGRLIGASTGI